MKNKKAKYAPLLLLTGAFLCTAFVYNGTQTPLLSAVRKTLYPAQKALSRFRVKNKDETVCQNCVRLLQEQNQTEAILLENKDLRAQLLLPQAAYRIKSVACPIVAFGTEQQKHTFWIAGGTKQGIQKNNAVVYGETLVGRVAYAEETLSQVVTLWEPNTAFDVFVSDASCRGIVKGGEKNSLHLLCLSNTTAPKTGQTVKTSGLGNCPAGFYVGTVTGVTPTNDGGVCANVRPETDYTALSVVSVVTENGDTP